MRSDRVLGKKSPKKHLRVLVINHPAQPDGVFYRFRSGMFSKKSKADTGSGGIDPELRELLQGAVDRNTTIGIVRLGNSGQDPLAQGRLLEWTDKGLVIEELQIIGRSVRFSMGTRVEAYVKYRDTTLMFEAEVTQISDLSRLNDRRVVRSLRLSHPRLLRKGDRRSAFRSSITANGKEIPVRMWFLDRLIEEDHPGVQDDREHHQIYFTDLLSARRRESLIAHDEDGNEVKDPDWAAILKDVQVEKPHAIGRLVDLTANGIGVLMYGIAKMQLNRFERMAIEFELEGEPIELIVEVRHGVDVHDSVCRVGFLIVHPHISNAHAPQRRLLEQVAMRVQRDQLRQRRIA